MIIKLHLTGNEVRLLLRALGRHFAVKKDPKAQELGEKIAKTFAEQREKNERKALNERFRRD